MIDVEKIRKDFPILDQIVNDEPLVYLDNAATTQKPKVVLESGEIDITQEDNANVHRGVHTLANGRLLPMKEQEKRSVAL